MILPGRCTNVTPTDVPLRRYFFYPLIPPPILPLSTGGQQEAVEKAGINVSAVLLLLPALSTRFNQ